MITFFRDFFHSSYDVGFYRRVRMARFRHALLYITLLTVTVSLLVMAIRLPATVSWYRHVQLSVLNQIPDDAQFTVEDGVFSSTIPQPAEWHVDILSIAIDDSFHGETLPLAFRDRFGVFVGAHALFFRAGMDSHSIPFSDMSPFDIDKDDISSFFAEDANGIFILGYVFVTMLRMFGMFLASLLFVAFSLLIVYPISRLMRMPISYASWFAIGLHALTLPTIADELLTLAGLPIPYVFVGLYSLIIVAVFHDTRLSLREALS